MSLVSDLVKSLAPTVATALGGPLAGAAVEFLAGKFGTDKTAEAVHERLNGMTEADAVTLKKLELDFQAHLEDNGIKLQLAQIDVNKAEAESTNWFVAGWRPAVGWVCVAALAFAYIPKAIVLTVFWGVQCYLTFAHPDVKMPALPIFPDLGVTDLLGLLAAILGIAGMRTLEKVKGAEGNR